MTLKGLLWYNTKAKCVPGVIFTEIYPKSQLSGQRVLQGICIYSKDFLLAFYARYPCICAVTQFCFYNSDLLQK